MEVPRIPETAPFSAEQRAWLNGFLAGLLSAGSASPQSSPRPQVESREGREPLLVLYGSQTGSAEGLAKRFADQARQRGFAPAVFPLYDYEKAGLLTANTAVIISSTWGDGDPPENAARFWDWIGAETAPRLERLSFAVLGLGDQSYADFCGAAKKFDARLEALGATRLVPRGECDVDFEPTANAWMGALWEKLGAAGGVVGLEAAFGVNGRPRNGHAVIAGAPTYGRSHPFPARLLRNELLSKPGSAKEVRHFEFDLDGSGLTYEPGDALGVVPANCPEAVDELIAALRSSPEHMVNVRGSVMALRDALTWRFDLNKPSPELLAAVAKAAPASEVATWLASENREGLTRWLHGRGVLDLLGLLDAPPPVADFLRWLRHLTPRLYSIASSPRAHAGQVHLTVSAVRYQAHGRARKGVASTYLADRVGEGGCVQIFVQPSPGFRPPRDGDTPMIMVGPGTGIAPFRAFLEERQATGAGGGNWLFFGDQRRATDFLYEDQIVAWQQSGLLRRLDVAFSRDQASKLYVQHRMAEHAAELWSWLETGAHFYVCGDAARMAKDVEAALHRVIETAGGRNEADAQAYVAAMKSAHRYQRDVY
ncbi:MAG: sulfite reductase subunit alpha [Verrucomicrobia bacterium]|nr:sulfite reductase subunit alpha [Verrucomicrobiota bacterium]